MQLADPPHKATTCCLECCSLITVKHHYFTLKLRNSRTLLTGLEPLIANCHWTKQQKLKKLKKDIRIPQKDQPPPWTSPKPLDTEQWRGGGGGAQPGHRGHRNSLPCLRTIKHDPETVSKCKETTTLTLIQKHLRATLSRYPLKVVCKSAIVGLVFLWCHIPPLVVSVLHVNTMWVNTKLELIKNGKHSLAAKRMWENCWRSSGFIFWAQATNSKSLAFWKLCTLSMLC